MGTICISRDDVSVCFVDSTSTSTKVDTFSHRTSTDGHELTMVTESDPSSGTAKTKAAFIQFRIPTIEEAGLHAKSQIFTMQLKTIVSVAGANVDVYKVKSSFEKINFSWG